jgi:hypothetical protein
MALANGREPVVIELRHRPAPPPGTPHFMRGALGPVREGFFPVLCAYSNDFTSITG